MFLRSYDLSINSFNIYSILRLDVLDFWSKNARVGIYPTLCQLASIHLSASAASVPVESMFSTTGLVANSKRSSLSAERLHRICFVHDNHSYLLCWRLLNRWWLTTVIDWWLFYSLLMLVMCNSYMQYNTLYFIQPHFIRKCWQSAEF